MNQESVLKHIQASLAEAPAAEVADAFLSPFIKQELFLQALDEEGPSLWIVNRSDVWSETLQMLARHRLSGIASRAQDKLKQRSSKVFTLAPPAVPKNFAEITSESVEDYLGHPLAPFESILFFSRALHPDHRGSAALSFARRILEYPPNWFEEKISRTEICAKMTSLLFDPSPYVRAYAARNPLLEAGALLEAFHQEKNPTVKARLLQHTQTPPELIEETLLDLRALHQDSTLQFVAALDSRSSINTRREVVKNRDLPDITRCIHEWYLS